MRDGRRGCLRFWLWITDVYPVDNYVLLMSNPLNISLRLKLPLQEPTLICSEGYLFGKNTLLFTKSKP